MSLTSKIRVAVLRGGSSSEYDISLQTGATVLKHLPEKYQGIDVLVDKNGIWHVAGLPKSPSSVLAQSDVVWNALHGRYGEDGQVQRILESHGMPFTGSTSFPSALAMNKILSKELFIKHGIKTPQYTMIKKTDDVQRKSVELFSTFPMPAIVRPSSGGLSLGVSLVRNLAELRAGIEQAFSYGDSVLVEECIIGRKASCGVIENFRDETLHALLPAEVQSEESIICPGNFSADEKKTIEDMTCRAHTAFGLRHYSQSDFIVSPKRGVYILDTNSLPRLTEQSLVPKALQAGGTSMPDFLDHVLMLTMSK